MKICIIGAAGFLGSHLVDYLSQYDDSKITAIDNLSTGDMNNLKNVNIVEDENKNIGKNILFFKQNIIKFKYPRYKYDYIYMLASKTNARNNNVNDFMCNIELVKKAIDLPLKKKGKFIFSSSCSVYGNNKNAKETDELDPMSLYAYSKYIGEKIIEQTLLPENYCIFRIGNIFGERQNTSQECGIISIIKEALNDGSVVHVFNKGNTKRDYIYVKELVKIMHIFSQEQGIINIGSGEMHKTLNIIKKSKVQYDFDNAIHKEPKFIRLNIDKIKNMKLKPKINILDYIRIIQGI